MVLGIAWDKIVHLLFSPR